MSQADSTNTTGASDVGEEALYLPTDVTPEQLFQAIGRLRKEARDEINRLIGFLDKTDDYMFRELEDSIDDNPMDDNELDGPEHEEDELSEPDEPSLGSSATSEWSNQEAWAHQPVEMRTAAGVDLEDEHDGGEPENEHADDADNEPSLGWTIEGVAGDQSGGDRELQNHATVAPKKRRKKLDQAIRVEDRGYGGRKVIRNLSDTQRKAVAKKMPRYGTISLD